jgi:hypothetical protein
MGKKTPMPVRAQGLIQQPPQGLGPFSRVARIGPFCHFPPAFAPGETFRRPSNGLKNAGKTTG